eukprot:scaffold470_cov72-Skeletonema_dohrnii-CCMP3373.AAC.2
MIEKKPCCIGYYESEEEAAVDYARALFKYKGQGAVDKAREQMVQNSFVDLTGAPPQSPFPKSAGRMKEGASKYAGIYFLKVTKKWAAQIRIDGTKRVIGYYEDEEEAAVDYARAVFKYKGGAHQQSLLVDLNDVPPQSPIPKSAGRIKGGASKFTGVSFHKLMNKWQAQIQIEGKKRCIGFYENEEEAAVDYARAVFKYGNGEAKGRAHQQQQQPLVLNLSDVPPQSSIPKNNLAVPQKRRQIDLSDVPPQLPIPESAGRIKEGSSQYVGVSSMNW